MKYKKRKNLQLIWPKNETEDLSLSITKNCGTLLKQTDTKAEDTLEFKLTKPRETFSFKPQIPNKGSRMIWLTNPEVYKSIFNLTEENKKFDLYSFPVSKIREITFKSQSKG